MVDANTSSLLDEIAKHGNDIVSTMPHRVRTANEEYEALAADADEWLESFARWRDTGEHSFTFFKAGQQPLTALGDRLVSAIRNRLLSRDLWEEPTLNFLLEARKAALATTDRYLEIRGH